jgi:hypothetical protein
MMMPKTWWDPHSETLSTFVLAAGCGVLTTGAVGSMSVSLLAYPVYFAAVNAAVAGVIAHRRRVLERGVDGGHLRMAPQPLAGLTTSLR